MLDIFLNKDISALDDGSIDLFVESYSNAARTIQIRGLTKDQQIIIDHSTNSDRSLATSVIPITSIPTALTARTSATSVSRGECYVRVSLRVDGVVQALLLAGYITDTGAPAYPNGKIEGAQKSHGLIRLVTGTDPAAGSEISETVPTGARWRVIAIRATLVADATVASRQVQFIFDDGTTDFFHFTSGTGQTASQTVKYDGAKLSNAQSTGQLEVSMSIPPDLILTGGMRFKTTTANLQAGDNWGAPVILVEEYIEP